jgi:serine/threonine protein phosphatase PrpC
MNAGPEPEPAGACPSCGQPVFAGDNFCEACRAELRPARVSGDRAETPVKCPSCPDSLVSSDGYCENCGHKVPSATDHTELDLGQLAGVTDRGLRHHRNEDAMALAVARTSEGPVSVAVVCDGVSTSSRPDEAAQAGAEAAVRVLLAAVRSGDDLAAASAEAVRGAQRALDDLAGRHNLVFNAPSATFVSAVVTGHAVTVCWLGDSRAYWLDAEDATAARRLTSDDSVGQELVTRGLLSEAEALASPQAHVVTGWIGADLSGAKPHVTRFTPAGPGVVLLCSDGLWNYRPEAAGLAELAMPTAVTDPLGAAAKLVTFAIDSGGADNVTVVLAPFPPPGQNPPGLPDLTEEIHTDEPV